MLSLCPYRVNSYGHDQNSSYSVQLLCFELCLGIPNFHPKRKYDGESFGRFMSSRRYPRRVNRNHLFCGDVKRNHISDVTGVTGLTGELSQNAYRTNLLDVVRGTFTLRLHLKPNCRKFYKLRRAQGVVS